MSGNVTSLRWPTVTANVRCSCGCEWFKVPGITIDASDGHPNGYIVDPVCVDCGERPSLPGGMP